MALEILELVGRTPPVRRSWLDPETRHPIRDFLDRTQISMPEFSEVAVMRIASDSEKAARFTRVTANDLFGLETGGNATVAMLRDRLNTVSQSLRTLSQRYVETQSALLSVLAVLGLTPRPLVIRGLGRVQELLELIGTVSPLRRSWFDVERRKAIRAFLEQTEIAFPEFSELAVMRLVSDPEGAIRLARLLDSDLSGPQSHGIATAFTLRDKLDAVLKSLQTLKERHAEMQSTLLRLLVGLGLTPRALSAPEICMIRETLATRWQACSDPPVLAR